MIEVTYVGNHQAVEVETKPGVFTIVRNGDSISVPDKLANGDPDQNLGGLLDQAVWARKGHEDEKLTEQAGAELAAEVETEGEDALDDADKATLIAAAEALGIEVSARWGEKRIREAIAEAEAN